MSEAPERIWLQTHMDDDPEEERDEVTWSENQIGSRDVEYIRKDIHEEVDRQLVAMIHSYHKTADERDMLKAEIERLRNRIKAEIEWQRDRIKELKYAHPHHPEPDKNRTEF